MGMRTPNRAFEIPEGATAMDSCDAVEAEHSNGAHRAIGWIAFFGYGLIVAILACLQ